MAKPSCPEEEVGNIWYTHTFFVLKRSVLHSFLSLNTSLSYAFPQLTSNARVIALHNYRHFFLYCFSRTESSIASTPQNAFRQMKLNFMVFFSMMKQSIKPKRPFHLFQDPTIWNSIKEIISKRNNIFILLKKSSQRGITKRWKRKILNWISWSYSLY